MIIIIFYPLIKLKTKSKIKGEHRRNPKEIMEIETVCLVAIQTVDNRSRCHCLNVAGCAAQECLHAWERGLSLGVGAVQREYLPAVDHSAELQGMLAVAIEQIVAPSEDILHFGIRSRTQRA